MSLQDNPVPIPVQGKTAMDEFEEELANWRQEYRKNVTSRIESISYQSPINPREGNDDDPAPPCFFYGIFQRPKLNYYMSVQT